MVREGSRHVDDESAAVDVLRGGPAHEVGHSRIRAHFWKWPLAVDAMSGRHRPLSCGR